LALLLALALVLTFLLAFAFGFRLLAGLALALTAFLPLSLVGGTAVGLFLIAALFVLSDLFREFAGAVGDLALVFGQFALLGAAFGSALDAFLEPQDAFHFFDVFADPVLFAFQTVGAVLAQQQIEQRLDVLVGFSLQPQQALTIRLVPGLELLQRRDAFV